MLADQLVLQFNTFMLIHKGIGSYQPCLESLELCMLQLKAECFWLWCLTINKPIILGIIQCLGLFSNTTHCKINFLLSSGVKVLVVFPLRKTHLQSLQPLSAIQWQALYKETVSISHLLLSRYEVKLPCSQANAIIQVLAHAYQCVPSFC